MTHAPPDIEVRNLAPFAHAKMTIHPLTVLYGPADIERTRLTATLCAVHDALRAAQGRLWNRHGWALREFEPLRKQLEKQVTNQTKAALETWRNHPDAATAVAPGENAPTRPIPLGAALVKTLSRQIAIRADTLPDKLEWLLAEPRAHWKLPGKTERPTTVVGEFRSTPPRGSHNLHIEWTPHARKSGCRTTLEEGLRLPVPRGEHVFHQDEQEETAERPASGTTRPFEGFDDEMTIGARLEAITRAVLGPLRAAHVREYHLPANRGGVMQLHRVLITDFLARQGRPDRDVTTFPGLMAGLLHLLVNLDSKRETPFADAATALERTVLDGEITVTPSQFHSVPGYGWKPAQGDEVDMARAPARVAALAPFVLLLRHALGRGDLVVIEEPEAHLDAAMQQSLLDVLTDIAEHGVQVVLSTSSKTLVEAAAHHRRIAAHDATQATQATDIGLYECRHTANGVECAASADDDPAT